MEGRGAARRCRRSISCASWRASTAAAARCGAANAATSSRSRRDGFSQHPYSLYGAPDAPSREPDDVRMGDLGRLSRAARALQRRGRIASQLPIFVTEYGYETNPPDVSGVCRSRNPGAISRTRDVPRVAASPTSRRSRSSCSTTSAAAGRGRGPVEASRDWHSGLYFHDGRAKPAVQAFKIPFWAEARWFAGQHVVVLFGQVRPERRPQAGRDRDARARRHVAPGPDLETRPAGDLSCGSRRRPFLTDAQGFFLRVVPYEGRLTYRARWIKADGTLRARGGHPRRHADGPYELLTITFIRILRGWLSQRIRQVPSGAELVDSYLPSVLSSERLKTSVAPGFLMATLWGCRPSSAS